MVVTDGAPTVFTEEVYDGAEASRKWAQAIEVTLENASLARVHLPEGKGELAALATDSDKSVLFGVEGLETPSGVHPGRRSGRWCWVLVAGGRFVIAGGVLAFAWLVFLAPLQGQDEQGAEKYRIETSRLDVRPLLEHCISELAEFWPMAVACASISGPASCSRSAGRRLIASARRSCCEKGEVLSLKDSSWNSRVGA